ncbi:ATP-binding cassette subfamily B protein [Bacillus mesophilus]|uniref:ABC transporter ATP-binding protein n=1 Tax=Bacillus mesophilus TaxID=1808955 RepID=A0A6M0Q374_9BACI|nr:ABC transporter ATP-binding protein [Bacillus mesophilus]MBM7659974.1 ATP-binding cassette subfamily B protein [Bacillus mesophilus]NEY70835.1 ABC transporter ATP-binding protein [Bacillus mesophilus]
MNISKRLLHYALQFKKTIIIALVMLTLAVAAELTGPFIAKQIIDQHILGIEKSWFKTTENSSKAVLYKDELYKREDYFAEGESKGSEVRILQAGRSYYFVPESIEFDGERTYSNGALTIKRGENEESYPAEKLSVNQLLSFYMPEVNPILWLIGAYFVLIVISAGFQYGQRLLLQISANRIIQKMRLDVFKQIQRLPINYFDNLPAGKIVSRVTNDTEAIRDLFVTVLSTFFTSIIYITGIYIALFLLDVKLAAICLVLVPILVVWIIVYRKYASKYNHVIRATLSDINGTINESIQGMTIIQAFKRQKETRVEFEELNKKYFTFQNKLLSLNAMTSHNLVFVLRNLAFVTLIWYFGGASLEIGTVISLGVLYAFVDYLNRLFQPITGMVNQLALLEQALVASERVFELLDEEGVDVTSNQLPRYKGNVSFENVSFGYKEGEHVLKNIQFNASQGETVALVGHTGSGKSSIMNLLFRFYDIKEGKILIDGINIKDVSKQQLRKHMGIVLQDPFLFTGTITSNVNLDDPSISTEKVIKALKDVGATRFIENLPNQYDEPVLEKGSTLSAGQRQLISFARALVFDPAILILDEATASIDTETESIIQEALEVLKKGRTTFIIAHRLSTIKNADQILVLDKGEIVEKGTHDELMNLGGRYFQMYKLQQGSNLAG